MGRLDGKTCFITGAAQGIGREVLDAFLREGAVVVAYDINGDGLKAVADMAGVTAAQLDVTDPDAVLAVATRFPDISILVNCAGYVATGTILECSPRQLDLSLEINVKSMFNTISAFLPNMVHRRAGSIVNIASVVSSVMAAPERFAYATSKAAVVGLTMSVAGDFAALGVCCNAISPGTVETPSLHARMEATGNAQEARRNFVSRQLMGRLGTAEEIAAIAVLMALDEAKFMTGSNVVIDGGMSL
ncbi:NAD(P)-dependent oxidoreductase [Agrobacterium sp. 13-626]|nr:NAD(P)-dependent oxidoreductase [Agrobacterium sp. 13-626]